MVQKSEIIGKGAFGCIIKPSLPCQDKKISYKNKVSKVAISEEVLDEFNEYAIINEIDKKGKYHLGKPTKCKIKKTKKALKIISKCDNLMNKYLKNKSLKENFHEFEQLIMMYGGVSLKRYGLKLAKMPVNRANKSSVRKLWFEFPRLFEGIISFQKHNIIHFDIKPDNIVYDKKKNVLKFIDFGHMSYMDESMKKGRESNFWMFRHAHWNYPLEIQYLNNSEYQRFSTMSDESKNQYFQKIVQEVYYNANTHDSDAILTFFKSVGKYIDPSYSENLFRVYSNGFRNFLLNTLKPQNYNYVLEKTCKTIDVFGLGMSCKEILNATADLIPNPIVNEMEECFFHMFDPDLDKRYTIQEAKTHFENILRKWKP